MNHTYITNVYTDRYYVKKYRLDLDAQGLPSKLVKVRDIVYTVN